MAKLTLISIGDATKDVFIHIKEASVNCQINAAACLFCLNYAEKIPVDNVVQVNAAGNAANAATGTCRLGHSTALVTMLGDDREGHELYDALTCERIDRRFIQFDTHYGTNYSAVLNFQGERTILAFHQPRTYVFPTKLPAADWIYYTAIGEKHIAYERRLLSYLASHSKTNLLFNPGVTHIRRGLASLAPILKRCTVLVLNKEEAGLLLMERKERPIPNLLLRLHQEGPHIVVITDGKHGSWATDGKFVWFLDIFPGQAKERTGAGDAFATGFVNALIEGESIPEALRWGTANSWSVVQFIGPQAGLLTRPQLKRILKKFKHIQPVEDSQPTSETRTP